MNQFFYTRKELVSGTPEYPVFKEFKDSFNINKVIRSVHMEDDRVLVLLDDIHDRPQEVPVYKPGTDIIKEYRRERNTFQTEIYLMPSDAERFEKLTSI